jgi:hypothetical protein
MMLEGFEGGGVDSPTTGGGGTTSVVGGGGQTVEVAVKLWLNTWLLPRGVTHHTLG